MKHILATLAFLSVVPAQAQDINAQLADIAGKDPVKAAMTAEEALGSSSPTARSLALEATLKSTDARVRAIGYGYLVKTQKLMVIEAVLPPNVGVDIEKSRFLYEARHKPPITLMFTKFDRETGQFLARAPGYGEDIATIARDGITIPFGWNGATCSVRFNSVEAEYLTGMAKCDTHSLKMRTALP